MTKLIQRFEVDFDFDWHYTVDLQKLKQDITTLEKIGVTEIDIYAEDNYGSPCIEIQAYITRLETDEEYNTRIGMITKKQEDIKERELAELSRLKLKYNQ